jgi:hypothetical protein
MSIKYHDLEYFIFKHILMNYCKKYYDIASYIMTFKYSGI